MDQTRIYTAAVLIIGNEILSGRTQDVNINFLAKGLGEIGVRLMEVRVIPDIEATIIATLNEVRAKFDYVFTTGGIGPTHDDITSECVAKAFGLPWELHPEARAILLDHYGDQNLTEARLRMATTPRGATLIENPVSKAPGFQVGNVFVMAGVPRIMQSMFDSLKHRLTGGAPLRSRAIVSTLSEGMLAKQFKALQDSYPDVEMGSYPFFRNGRAGTSLVLRAIDEPKLDRAADEVRAMIRGLGGDPVDEAVV